jgi:copper chaperone CopZ
MKIIIVIILSLFSSALFAQTDTTTSNTDIESVSLKAGGLTCSMCSKAIYKSLMKVPSVSKVDPDIENSSYTIFFKKKQPVKLEDLREAVTGAGFSVESLVVNRVAKKPGQ